LLLQNESARNNLRDAAKQAGLDPERLRFSGALRIDKHLSRLQLADIAVDTFSYNGGATTANALWAGLPVVTLIGKHLVSRMSASALHAVGLDSLIAHSPQDYENLVTELAMDSEKRKRLRFHLNRQRTISPLFDTLLFTRHLEQAYHTMYRRYKSGLPPTTFAVRSTADTRGQTE
jgi:protein O-GlcNAc transferase